MIRNCKCNHKGQDELHGPGRRVWNFVPPKAGSKTAEFRCTVCGAVHTEQTK